MTATITDIFRYPVKSMGGHSLDSADLGENGIPGDRCWTIRDEVRGGIKVGKRFPVIMNMQARLMAEPSVLAPSPTVEITLPDGSLVDSGNPAINEQLSEVVGSPVSFWPLLPKDQLQHYLRAPPAPGEDGEAAMRAVFARTPDEPLPDLSQFPPELFTYESPPGTYFDAFPLLILSTSSLRSMAALSSSVFDVRRFRPNILVETDAEGFPEQTWAGRRGLLGDAELRFEMACPRCVMTTHGFAELPKDPSIMRALVRGNDGNLGIYASVERSGRIRIGDRLKLLD